MSSDNLKIYVGNIVTGGLKDENLITREALVIKEDTIIASGNPDKILSQYSGEIIRLSDTQILAPGYVDA